jgi:hypothetical protein
MKIVDVYVHVNVYVYDNVYVEVEVVEVHATMLAKEFVHVTRETCTCTEIVYIYVHENVHVYDDVYADVEVDEASSGNLVAAPLQLPSHVLRSSHHPCSCRPRR